MTISRMDILLGGAAGQGLDTSANLLSQLLSRLGYQVLVTKDYMSRIRGGHNFYKIAIDNKPIKAPSETVNMVFCFNQETMEKHQYRLTNDGILIGELTDSKESEWNNKSFNGKNHVSFHLPWIQWAAKEVENPKTVSTVALASISYFLGVSHENLSKLISESFKENLVEVNQKAVQIAYDFTESAVSSSELLTDSTKVQLPQIENSDEQLLISGNEASGMSAIASGCKFFSTYPMTPSTGILTYLAGKQSEANLVVEQAEDEIAGINKALGASSSGVRSMTATSGGGFSLMVEALGLSGVGEIPLVAFNVQRPGPATGLPTRTEQADLQFVISAAQGEFPRAVISLTSVEDAFYKTNRAFEIAEKYQIPVIVLSDQYLADLITTLSPFDFSKLECNDYTATEEDIKRHRQEYGKYARYELTDSGISPRVYPGQYSGETVLHDSHEHDIFGNITEDSKLRTNMVDKRMKKMSQLQTEMTPPEWYGSDDPELLFVGWGSTKGILQESVDKLRHCGYSVGLLHFSDLIPFPDTNMKELADKARIVSVENNATGQLAQLIARETGTLIEDKILHYDGRQITWEEIVNQAESLLKGDK